MQLEKSEYSIYTEGLTYTFPHTNKVGLFNLNIQLLKSSRLLIVGPNGAGKSTLLKILAGQKLVKNGKILLNGVDPFDLQRNNRERISTGVITYLGTEWANNEITKRDVPVTILIDSVGGSVYPERRDLLINLLDIDITWRMNQCSDGERRRVQLLMGLLKPWDILLLDEVTVDLDVLVRSRLLSFLKLETESRGSTIVYATHIFDGLGEWPTEILHLNGGCSVKTGKYEDIEYFNELSQDVTTDEDGKVIKIRKSKTLYPLALDWLKDDLDKRGERTEDKTRPKFEDLNKLLTGVFYDDVDRVTEYFKTTRKT
ncbi:hypothetical protein CANARDRAFT_71364 [[Candida] arabinofermentans NRRL YB-2248]|uniref:ABC transporter domain-containing protein n=1 Tax=[Candida] arabinofermentans NRRL YB-2248 TaxID=983967 RepID=A0A1E4SX55_9ASCO|nr:hypothetical protein CANARDRAFT_71364 [[Candida] arabinofermentans NRRL YB-2248]